MTIRLTRFLEDPSSWEETSTLSPERPSRQNIKRLLPSIDGITDRKPVMEREEGETNIISGAARSENPAQYLQDGLQITEDELIQRVKKWIEMTSKLPEWAKIREYTFENRYYWPSWVLLETWEKGIMKQVHNRIPTQADWATFVIVKYTTEDWKEWKKEFALLCMNWLVKEYEEPWVAGKSIIPVNEWNLNNAKNLTRSLTETSDKPTNKSSYNGSRMELFDKIGMTTAIWLAIITLLWYNTCSHKPWKQDVEKEPKVTPQKSNIWNERKEYVMPIWGSLIWTVWMTEEQAKKFAKDNWLKGYHTPDGKYIVVIQPWDVILEWKKWEYQLLRKREVHQN